ncbi:uncharacterized protein LOC132260663 [Phlebotomus argentipes]|uniref:uncharacterized protein LOC132260663 n=1 Tax=Phlebotomus argentipes TaxID=94469 RepID=UPI0028932A01|nr:uncharacterized protein LOC132260663 [Phlebotomus argentipes]
MTRCSFEGCDNLYVPCSRLTFFNLPKNEKRREIWIANSGNRSLMRDYMRNKSVRRLFCEKHFMDQYKKCQANRTILYREAVPDAFDKELARAFLQNGREGLERWEQDADVVPVAIVAPRNHNEQDNEYVFEVAEFTEPEAGEESQDVSMDVSDVEVVEADDAVAETVNKLIKTYSTRKPFRTTVKQKSPSLDTPAAPAEEESPAQLPPFFLDATDWEISEETDEVDDVICEYVPAVQPQEVREEIPEIRAPTPVETFSEEDRCFVLSLLEPLKKLTSEQRAVAKVNILKYLLELEVGKKTATL